MISPNKCKCGNNRKYGFKYCDKCRGKKVRERQGARNKKRETNDYSYKSGRDSTYWYFFWDEAWKTRPRANQKGVF